MRRHAGSGRHLTVRALTPERVDEAYPVVRAAMPTLSLRRWREFARRALAHSGEGAPSGILLVESARGYIHGLCAFHVQHDLRHGPVLAIDELVTLDLVDTAPAAAALMAALEARARDLGCAAVRSHVPETAPMRSGGAALRQLLERCGHSIEGTLLLKPVDPGWQRV